MPLHSWRRRFSPSRIRLRASSGAPGSGRRGSDKFIAIFGEDYPVQIVNLTDPYVIAEESPALSSGLCP